MTAQINAQRHGWTCDLSLRCVSCSERLRTEELVEEQPVNLADLDRELEAARRALHELWLNASPTDRIFAVDRLLREETVPMELEDDLERLAERVRDAWSVLRSRRHAAPSAADTLQAELSLELAERERDDWLERHDLFDALFSAAESYLHDVPILGERTFRELLRQRTQLRASLVRILPPLDETRAA
jgi:hypothetical protein